MRGVAGVTRASRFGRVSHYANRAHEEICLLVQIETREGLDNLEKIARVDGVDGVFIGPADLAAGLGHLGDQGHPEVQSAIKDAIASIKACGKPAGILATDEASARRYIEWGTTFTAVGLDVMVLARETEKLAAKFKSWRKTTWCSYFRMSRSGWSTGRSDRGRPRRTGRYVIEPIPRPETCLDEARRAATRNPR